MHREYDERYDNRSQHRPRDLYQGQYGNSGQSSGRYEDQYDRPSGGYEGRSGYGSQHMSQRDEYGQFSGPRLSRGGAPAQGRRRADERSKRS